MKTESEKYQEDLEAQLLQFMVDAVAFVIASITFTIVICALAVVYQ